MTQNLNRLIVLVFFTAGSLCSQAYVCIDASQISKSIEMVLQSESSRDQLQELKGYLSDPCPSLEVLSEFADSVRIGSIRIEEESYIAALLPKGKSGPDRISCKIKIPYIVLDFTDSSKNIEKEIVCSMDKECPEKFQNTPIKWDNIKELGGDFFACPG
ncbi:MAG: hypothetical protein IPL83_06040 [Bdellovibrionales bacterium]|nr:hypothetical protein [Bdellovibrionales bacterium]